MQMIDYLIEMAPVAAILLVCILVMPVATEWAYRPKSKSSARND
jgi:hypothetical protein